MALRFVNRGLGRGDPVILCGEGAALDRIARDAWHGDHDQKSERKKRLAGMPWVSHRDTRPLLREERTVADIAFMAAPDPKRTRAWLGLIALDGLSLRHRPLMDVSLCPSEHAS
jgi:hypothetical protein